MVLRCFSFSIYIRHCASVKNGCAYKKGKRFLPEKGMVAILNVTDKQFGAMELFIGRQGEKIPTPFCST